MGSVSKFATSAFALDVARAKFADLGWGTRDSGSATNALEVTTLKREEILILVRGRHRTAGPTESQEDEQLKISLESRRGNLLDYAPKNTHLCVVVVKAVSERVETVIAPLSALLEVNSFANSGRRDICYVRMDDEQLAKYTRMPTTLLYESEPLASWQALYDRYCGPS